MSDNNDKKYIIEVEGIGPLVVLLLVVGIIFGSVAYSCGAQANPNKQADYEQEINDYLDDFLDAYPKRRAQVQSYIPVIVEAALYEQRDPLLVATIISLESSWRTEVQGIIGERGLMQVHGIAAKGFDLSTIEGQVRAGAKHLGLCLDKCEGDVGQALGCYMTRGFCNGSLWPAKHRLKAYRGNIKKYRSE